MWMNSKKRQVDIKAYFREKRNEIFHSWILILKTFPFSLVLRSLDKFSYINRMFPTSQMVSKSIFGIYG
jgi:hypothetical protein